ncbi:MAG: hypothetical protein JWN67_1189 [Actinomycetia bacterium]|nr:hypothetical protein [Actinomycetes bacterium]
MAFDLDTYKRVTGRLEYDDVDFDAFRDQPLDEASLRCLRYMHDIEEHTSCYLRNLLNTRAHYDPEITTFLTMWNFEELWHGEAIGQVLAAHDEPGTLPRVARMRERLGRKIGSPIGWMAFSAATKHFLAVHMTFGVVNEWTTQAAYSRLASVCDHPVLADLLRRIMKQEGRHIDFYLDKAKEHLEPLGARRQTRFVMKHFWKPVGSSLMPEDDTRHLARTLFAGAEGRPMLERIDRRIDRLPGLGDLHLLTEAFGRCALA